MNIYTLIEAYNRNNPNGHFFDRDTLKFFGERISEMRVFKDPVTVEDYSGKEHTCWCVSSYQRKHPIGARRAYHYFDTESFDCITQ